MSGTQLVEIEEESLMGLPWRLAALTDNTQGLGVGVDARSEQKLLLSVLLNSNRHV
jgi:hypothetical protein